MLWPFRRRLHEEDYGRISRDLVSGNVERVCGALVRLRKQTLLRMQAMPLIVQCLESPQPAIRRLAKLVVATGGAGAAAELVALLCKGPTVHAEVKSALQMIGNDAVPALRHFLWQESQRASPDERAVKTAMELVAQNDPVPAEVLCSYLDSPLADYAVDLLAQHGDQVVPKVKAMFYEADPGPLVSASDALRRLGDPGFRALIDLLLERQAPEKRAPVLKALAEKHGSYMDFSFFTGWRKVEEVVLLLLNLVNDEPGTAKTAAWLVRSFMPLVSAAERERVESAAAFVLLGRLEDRVRKQLERGLHGDGGEQELLLSRAA